MTEPIPVIANLVAYGFTRIGTGGVDLLDRLVIRYVETVQATIVNAYC